MRIENSYTLNEYKEKYPFLLEKFLLEYEDHDEVMFATAEIKEFYAGLIDIPAIEASNEYVKLLHENIQIELDKNGDLDFLESAKKHNLSSFKIIVFLESKLSYFETKTTPTEPTTSNSLNWNGTQTEFIELTKALIENGNITGTGNQEDKIHQLANLLNFKINNPYKLLNDIKNTRNDESETLFLDKLKRTFFNYITLEKKK